MDVVVVVVSFLVVVTLVASSFNSFISLFLASLLIWFVVVVVVVANASLEGFDRGYMVLQRECVCPSTPLVRVTIITMLYVATRPK